MRKILFSLVTLFGLLLGSVDAYAVCPGNACFWIGGTGTVDLATDSAHWSGSSGGTTCSCEPAASDQINFDGSSGGGTVTVNTGGTWTMTNLLMSAFTGTLDFSINNNSVTITANFNNTSTATRTLKMGNGTWTMSSSAAIFNQTTTTNLTFQANSSTIAFTGTTPTLTAQRQFLGGGLTYNVVTFAANLNLLQIKGANAFSTLTIAAPAYVIFPNSATQTVTTMTNITGSAGSEAFFQSSDFSSGRFTISSANNWTCSWCSFSYAAFTGGGTFTGSNSFDLGFNTGITITAPVVGGGGGGHIIGG